MGRRAGPRAVVLTDVDLPERYELVRRIARGGMATVWCARDRTLERNVAIKLLAEPFTHDELSVRRFKREARTAARLSGHRNVVTIYDVGQAPPSEEWPLGRPFIVMEHMPGGTAADALRVGEASPSRAVQWMYEAAAALDYAHARGVIHRDVKLANFLLDRDRVLHVADFGIAQMTTEDTLTGTGQVLGTAAYMAPERALGQPATEASDRYALAVAAFELLVGERPFTSDHFAVLARAHIEDEPPLASRRNPELPRALDPVLARGLAKRPEQRFATAGELAEQVERALHARPVRTTAVTVPIVAAAGAVRSPVRAAAPLPAPRRRSAGPSRPAGARRGRIAAIGALALAAVAVAIALGSGHTSARRAAITHHRTVRGAVHGPAGTSTQAVLPTSTDPNALEAQGHQLIANGDYGSAIPVLRQAVTNASPSSLTYAYALYDLGHALRLAGDPRAAIPILRRRLEIPNQTETVRTELEAALRMVGGGGGGDGGGGGGD